jgi:hypothetical protein
MAEREGFEPSERLPAHVISNHAPSATRSPLRNGIALSSQSHFKPNNSNRADRSVQAFCKAFSGFIFYMIRFCLS